MAKKARKKAAKIVTCSTDGCRKKPMEGSELCQDHQNPMDVVKRLSEVELLRLGKIGAEVEAAILRAKLVALEGQQFKAKAEEEIRKKEEERQSHMDEARQLKAAYSALTVVLATKYSVSDPNRMVVDPETGVIRDLSDI